MAMSPRNHDVLAAHSVEEINALLRAELYDPSIVLGGNMMSLCGQPSGASIVSPQPELCDILPPPPVAIHFEPSAPPLEAAPTSDLLHPDNYFDSSVEPLNTAASTAEIMQPDSYFQVNITAHPEEEDIIDLK